MELRTLVEESYRNAVDHGFHDTPRSIPEALMLIVSELAEALEDYRDGKMTTYLDEKGKPCGFPSEIADVFIRLADTCGELGINIETEIEEKMAYNATRPRLHGGKRI